MGTKIFKKKADKVEWDKNGNNEFLLGEGFYISYNPDTGADIMNGILADLGNIIIGEDALKREGAETALVIEEADGESILCRKFLILEGDFRKEYEEAFPKGIEACRKVYDDNKEEHNSNWSTGKKIDELRN